MAKINEQFFTQTYVITMWRRSSKAAGFPLKLRDMWFILRKVVEDGASVLSSNFPISLPENEQSSNRIFWANTLSSKIEECHWKNAERVSVHVCHCNCVTCFVLFRNRTGNCFFMLASCVILTSLLIFS